jgi:hypothetical protein
LDTKKICINAGFLKYKLDCMMKLPHPWNQIKEEV